jgi:hypothetical protein
MSWFSAALGGVLLENVSPFIAAFAATAFICLLEIVKYYLEKNDE